MLEAIRILDLTHFLKKMTQLVNLYGGISV